MYDFVKKLSVRELHQVEGDTNHLVTIVKVDIENLLVVVDDRDNTYTDSTGSPTVTEEERMVFSTGGKVSLFHNVRSPIFSVPCACELF